MYRLTGIFLIFSEFSSNVTTSKLDSTVDVEVGNGVDAVSVTGIVGDDEGTVDGNSV